MSNKEYRKIKHALFANKDPIENIKNAFQSDFSLIKKYINELCEEAIFKKALTGLVAPTQLNQIVRSGSMPLFRQIDNSLLWYVALVKMNADYINRFIIAQNAYDEAFLLGNYQQCQTILNTVSNVFGYSLWGICKQISLYGELGDANLQKEYTQTIVREFKEHSFERSYIIRYSHQCEGDTSASVLFNNLERESKAYEVGQYTYHYKKYAQFKLHGPFFIADSERIDEETLSYILCQDGKYPLIDRYMSLRSVITYVFLHGSVSLQEHLTSCVFDLGQCLIDPIFSNITFFLENGYLRFHQAENPAFYQVYDGYCQSQYYYSQNASINLLNESYRNFPLIEIYAKSCFFSKRWRYITKSHSLINRVGQTLAQLMTLEGDCEEYQNNLLKILFLNANSVWAADLAMLLKKYTRQGKLLPNVELSSIANLTVSFTTSESLYFFPPHRINDFLHSTPESFRMSLSVRLSSAIRREAFEELSALPLDEDRKNKYIATLLLNTDPKTAISMLTALEQTEYGARTRLKTDSLLIQAELSIGNMNNAMERFVDSYLYNQNFIYIGNLEPIVMYIKENINQLCHSVCAPIICSIYFTSSLSQHDHDIIVLSLCLEQFMEAIGEKRLTDLLIESHPSIISNRDVYFLSEVYVPKVMDLTILFDSQEDILRERIAICKELFVLDADNAERYHDEIHDCTHQLLTEITRREIESGRIYIDMSKIQPLVRSKVLERYNNYSMQRKENDKKLQSMVLGEINNYDPRMEKDLLSAQLEDIIKTVRDIFVSDSTYGLDGYLSVGIRHGTLQGRIRGCFERLHLITLMDKDGQYLDNSFFVRAETSPYSEEINQVFAKFSKQIDAIISHLKDDLIQIQTEAKNTQGLFDFKITQNETAIIESRINLDTTYPEFEKCILDYLTNQMRIGLVTIQETLLDRINNIFQASIDDLQNGTKQYSNYLPSLLPDMIVTARTNISNELSAIAQWFRQAQTKKFSDYSLLYAISTAYKLTHGSTSDPPIPNTNDYINLSGSSLPAMVDIFSILFDNIRKHSGLSWLPPAEITIRRVDNRIIIRVENEVSPGSIDEKKLQTILLNLKKKDVIYPVNTEGGTGLYKIHKLLTSDLAADDFKIDCANNYKNFSVIIDADLSRILI